MRGKNILTATIDSVHFKKDKILKTNPFFKNVKWMDIEDTSELYLDHSLLVAEARKVLVRELLSQPLLLSFLPNEFTIPELQKLYEVILGRSVDRGNFRKRMLKSDIF